MTAVVIPLLRGADGTVLPARYRVALVDADGRPRIGWRTADGVPVVAALDGLLTPAALGVDGSGQPVAALTLPLLAQPLLGFPGAEASWYEITLSVEGRSVFETWRVQVPANGPVALADLVGAAGLTPGDVLAGRLLPPADDVPDGWSLSVQDGVAVWVSVPPGSGVPEAPLVGGPFGRQGGAWAPIEAGAGPQGPAGPVGPAGPKGDAGNAGPAGIQGPKGDPGNPGPAGADGAAGPVGPSGPAGPAGPAGAAGHSPVLSWSGDQIAIDGSLAGAPHLTGPQGPTGPQGAGGPAGPAGPAGSAGAAASVAVGSTTTLTAGSSATVTNTGTASAAILTFGIPQGPAGAPGATGPAGPAGPAGPQGPPGSSVPRVQTAATGASVTPAADSYDAVRQANTEAAGTLTIGAPTGTPVDYQRLRITLYTQSAQVLAWNAIYQSTVDASLPGAAFAAGEITMLFEYHAAKAGAAWNKWDLLAVSTIQ